MDSNRRPFDSPSMPGRNSFDFPVDRPFPSEPPPSYQSQRAPVGYQSTPTVRQYPLYQMPHPNLTAAPTGEEGAPDWSMGYFDPRERLSLVSPSTPSLALDSYYAPSYVSPVPPGNPNPASSKPSSRPPPSYRAQYQEPSNASLPTRALYSQYLNYTPSTEYVPTPNFPPNEFDMYSTHNAPLTAPSARYYPYPSDPIPQPLPPAPPQYPSERERPQRLSIDVPFDGKSHLRAQNRTSSPQSVPEEKDDGPFLCAYAGCFCKYKYLSTSFLE